MFQFMSYSVRSTTASRLRWPRVLPNASAAGATQVPVAETGRVMPLIVPPWKRQATEGSRPRLASFG